MDLGFDTVGNATLIVYDRGPRLVTDPWLGGPAYFGSWGLSHEVLEEQLSAAAAADFIWFSHGHPDHLNGAWLSWCRGRKVLVPDHVGGRIRCDLERIGLEVHVLPHAKWVPLTERIRVWCFADAHQDAVLLIDLDGRMIVNINDCVQTGWGPAVKREVGGAERRFLLQLSGYGSDMMNFTDENGNRLKPLPQLRKERGYQVGDALARVADAYGITDVIPFSSMHRYQRTDSVWATPYVVEPSDFSVGFGSKRATLRAPFVRFDARRDTFTGLAPSPSTAEVLRPSDFGDDYSEELTPDEQAEVRRYVRRAESLLDGIGFMRFVVGGRETIVDLGANKTRGITFRVPRGSLLAAVRHEIFDDLLICNFMEATLHGKWGADGLGTHFGPYLTRYADNGRAYSTKDVAEYLRVYKRRLSIMDQVRHAFEGGGARVLRSTIQVDTAPYRAARAAYWAFRRVR